KTCCRPPVSAEPYPCIAAWMPVADPLQTSSSLVLAARGEKAGPQTLQSSLRDSGLGLSAVVRHSGSTIENRWIHPTPPARSIVPELALRRTVDPDGRAVPGAISKLALVSVTRPGCLFSAVTSHLVVGGSVQGGSRRPAGEMRSGDYP